MSDSNPQAMGSATQALFTAPEPADRGPRIRSGLWGLALALIVTFAWRLAILDRTEWAIESDEATIGLMAKHIARGESLPVWYYGQHYMGSLEAFTAAPFVALFGSEPAALKLSILPWVLLWIVSAWALARRVFGPSAAGFTALYLALPPLVLSIWSLKLRGGYVSMLGLGHLILLIAHRMGNPDPVPEAGGIQPSASALEPSVRRRAFLLGFASGVGIWLNLLVLPFLFAAAIYLLTRRKLWTSWTQLRAATLGGVLGTAPFWIDNLLSGGATFSQLLSSGEFDRWANLKRTLSVHFPVLLGAQPPWFDESSTRAWLGPIVWIFALALTFALIRWRSSLWRAATFSKLPTSGIELYLLTALGYLGCAVGTDFGGEPGPRYAVVLTVMIAPIFGAAIGTLWDTGSRQKFNRRWLAAGICLGLMGMNAAALLQSDQRKLVAPLHFVAADTIPPLHWDETHAFLEEHNVRGLAADLWVGMQIAFETDERVTPAPSRYAPHFERYATARPRAWLVRPQGGDAEWVLDRVRNLSECGVKSLERECDGYLVSLLLDEGLPSEHWRARSSNGEPAEIVFDRDPRSAWKTVEGEPPGQSITIDMRRPELVQSIGCIFGVEKRPGALRVELSADHLNWETAVEAAAKEVRWQASFPAQRARYIRLTQSTRTGRSWALAEVFLFGPDDAETEPRPESPPATDESQGTASQAQSDAPEPAADPLDPAQED